MIGQWNFSWMLRHIAVNFSVSARSFASTVSAESVISGQFVTLRFEVWMKTMSGLKLRSVSSGNMAS